MTSSTIKSGRQAGIGLLVKRVFDISVALVLGTIATPVLVVIASVLLFANGRPVLFCQCRPGHYGVPFMLVKFRTMSDERDVTGALLPDGQRLGKVGRIVRSLSLDELPQLWNVLCGDLSLVGPRPLLMRYLDRYNPEQARRHEVLPGITGWAQINGRNNLTWEEKFTMDVWYVDHWSLTLDLRILFRTIMRVLSRKDISTDGNATAPEFMGSNGVG